MSSTTHDARTDSAPCSDLDEKITPATGTDQIAGFAEFRPAPAHELKKDSIYI